MNTRIPALVAGVLHAEEGPPETQEAAAAALFDELRNLGHLDADEHGTAEIGAFTTVGDRIQHIEVLFEGGMLGVRADGVVTRYYD